MSSVTGMTSKSLKKHSAVGPAVHLQSELARFLTRLVDDIRHAESVQRLDQAVAVRANRNEFVNALRRVIEVSQDASTVSRAKGYMEGV